MKNGDWRVNRSYAMTPKARQDLLQKIRLAALAMLGGACMRCGFDDERALQIDHVKGDGAVDRKRYRGTSYYYHIIKELKARVRNKYQALCANCNWIKRRENQECKRIGIQVGNIKGRK